MLTLTELNKRISLQERVYRKRNLKSTFFSILTLSLHGWKISLATTTKQCLFPARIWNIFWQWMVWKLPCILEHVPVPCWWTAIWHCTPRYLDLQVSLQNVVVYGIFFRTFRLFQAKLYSFLREDINLCLHFFVFPSGGRISRHVEINNVLVPWATRFF